MDDLALTQALSAHHVLYEVPKLIVHFDRSPSKLEQIPRSDMDIWLSLLRVPPFRWLLKEPKRIQKDNQPFWGSPKQRHTHLSNLAHQTLRVVWRPSQNSRPPIHRKTSLENTSPSPNSRIDSSQNHLRGSNPSSSIHNKCAEAAAHQMGQLI